MNGTHGSNSGSESGKGFITEEVCRTNYSSLTLLNQGKGIEAQRTVVIVGVERGGTSMVAGVLRTLGLFLGDRTGRNHENPDFQTEDREKLSDVIGLLNNRHDVWGFKYPRASLMVPFYDRHLRNPLFILVARNIASVVDSWCSRGTNDPIDTARHASEYYSAVLSAIQGSERPAVLVNYENACHYPEDFVSDIAEFVGIEPTYEQWKNATQMITGEGGGYLNIPEHNFYIGEDSIPVGSVQLPLRKERVSFTGKVEEQDTTVTGLSCSLMEGSLLPDAFYVEVSVDPGSIDCEMRVYADFGDGFFSRHSYPLQFMSESNRFRFVTSGKVVAFCIAAPSSRVIDSMDIELFNEHVQGDDSR